jgi:hypothetical protein
MLGLALALFTVLAVDDDDVPDVGTFGNPNPDLGDACA